MGHISSIGYWRMAMFLDEFSGSLYIASLVQQTQLGRLRPRTQRRHWTVNRIRRSDIKWWRSESDSRIYSLTNFELSNMPQQVFNYKRVTFPMLELQKC